MEAMLAMQSRGGKINGGEKYRTCCVVLVSPFDFCVANVCHFTISLLLDMTFSSLNLDT